jgi:hypothetical protein
MPGAFRRRAQVLLSEGSVIAIRVLAHYGGHNGNSYDPIVTVPDVPDRRSTDGLHNLKVSG